MITRTLFFASACHLKTVDNQLVAVYDKIAGQEGMPDKKAPIEDIGCIVLEHRQITLSHALLGKLLDNNVAIVACDEKMMPAGMFLSLEGNTLQSERFRAQIEASEPLKKQLWQQTISAKIRNQAAVLSHWGIENTYLIEQAKSVKSGDSENAEAKCSYYYWQRLFPPAWNFYRKRDGLPPNNLLNYGYAIIRAVVARALTGSGLLPTLGIFHRNRYNAFCLADDIMEPYRPYVDFVVREIIDSTSHLDLMRQEHKTKLLNVLSADVIIDDVKSPVLVAVQRTASSLAKCYLGESRKILYPIL
jgi:CRISPR-associated protein Cas1